VFAFKDFGTPQLAFSLAQANLSQKIKEIEMSGILNFLIRDIVGTPAILVGLIALIGLLLQKKPFSAVLAGGVKTAAGYLIFSSGSTIAVGVLNNFLSPLIQKTFNLTAPAAAAGGIGYPKFLETWGGYVTVAVALGFIINLILARFSPFKFIYLTGHLMIVGAEVTMAGLLASFLTINPVVAIIITGILLGIYWTLQPAIINKFMKGVTKSDDLAYGHTSAFACWLAAFFGRFVGKPAESTEDIEMPTAFEFFKDTVVSLSLVLGIFSVILAIVAGPKLTGEFSLTKNYIVYALIQGFTFGAGISIVLYGVRLIIGELVPAFRGISKVLVPGAKPALDCPIVFAYAPNAVIIGFLASFGAFLLSMVLIGVAGWGVIIPSMIPIFFPGAAAGVFGNSTGGWKGAILGGAICGFLLAFGQLIVGNALAASVPYQALRSDPDTHLLSLIGTQLGNIFKLFGA
jgi:PTS system ascorbate-specific IIC component